MKTKEALRRERMETPMTVLVSQFISDKKIEGRARNTIIWYQAILNRFAAFLGDIRLGNLSIEDARRFIQDLQSRQVRYPNHPISRQKTGGLSAHTISCYVRTLKVFSRWLMDEGFTKEDLFSRLKRPKLPESVIEVLSDTEIQSLVDSINPNCCLGARMNAVVLLLLDTGIRASELTTLTKDNVHLEDNYVKVFGKGNKERVVPIANGAKKAMLRYLTTFRPESNAPQFFLSADGTPLTYDGLKQIVDRLRGRSGVKRLHLHLFRHTFAVKYLLNGGDLITLQRILGHTTLQVTQMYLHLVDSDIKVQHSRFSPADCLGLGVRRGRRVMG